MAEGKNHCQILHYPMTALKRITAFCCPALLWLLALLPAQSAAQYNYTIKNFTNENGLSQNAITDMAMDYSGYLWIGTEQGLIRYDGSTFKTFLLDKKKTNPLGNSVWSIMNTPFDKQLFIKTKNGVLYSIEKGQPRLLDSSQNNRFESMRIAGQYPTLAVAKQFDIPQDEMVRKMKWQLNVHIVPLNKTDFLMGHKRIDSLFLYKGKTAPEYIPLPGHFRMMMYSEGRQLVLCDPGDIYLYDSSKPALTKLVIPGQFKEIVNNALKGNSTDIFQGLYSGESFIFYKTTMYLIKVDVATRTIRFIPQFTLPKSYRWNKIVYDSVNATFFLGTINEGILQVKLQKIKTYDLNVLLPLNRDVNDFINYTLLRLNDSTVVIPSGFRFTETDTGIVLSRPRNSFSIRQTVGRLGDSAVIGISERGLIYFLQKENYTAVHDFNASFNKYRHKKLGSVSLLQPEGDSVWVSYDWHLFCISGTQAKEYTPAYKNGTKAFELIHLFYRLNKNEVLVSNRTGFYKMTLSPRPVYEEMPGMEKIIIRHISPYKNVLIAAGYRSGLYILKDGQSYKVPLPAAIPELAECHSTHIDKQGFIWITTNKGLFKSTAESVVQAALTQGSPPYFFCFGRNDGINNLEFNGGGVPAYAVLPGERLFYPSMGGIVTFKAGDLKDRISNTPVFVEDIFIDKKLVPQQDSVFLPADFSILDIDLAAVNFADPRNLLIEYKLDDGQWEKISAGKELRISLVKITAGWHQLTIRKRTGFGDKDFIYTYLSINRAKKLQEQWWFFLGIILLLAVMVGLLLQVRTRNLIKKKEQLQELVNLQTEELSKSIEAKDMMIGIITHDMLTPLKHVSFIAAILEKGMEKDPQKMTEALKDIKETSDKIHSGSQSIVNWMKYNNKNVAVNKQPLHLYSFTESVLAVYQPIAKNKNVSLVNNVDQSIFVEVDHNIFNTIFTNIISNAIKHTKAGEIKAETIENNGKTILRVTDTGGGISEATLSIIREVLKGNLRALKASSKVAPGLGYIIISELIKVHDLSVSIESTPGKGTTVSLFI